VKGNIVDGKWIAGLAFVFAALARVRRRNAGCT